jgi:uncharacterized protein YkwD
MARRLLVCSIAVCALALPSASASAATCAGADTTIGALTLDSARDAVLCIVNAERSARGLTVLAQDDQLELAAQRHSEDMLARDYFDHVNPDGEDPGDRVTAAGYEWSAYGENIAAGYSTPRKVMLGWMKSEGHCHNVLNPSFTELGVGVTALAATLSRSLGTWTQNFGRPRGTRAPGSDEAPSQGCPYANLEGLDGTVSGTSDDGDNGHGSEDGDDTDHGAAGDEHGSPAGQTPASGDVPFSIPGTLSLSLQRSGRRLTLAGAAPTAGVARLQVTLLRHGRVIYRGTTRVRSGAYRLRLRGVPRGGRIVVRVRGGGQRVTRSIG